MEYCFPEGVNLNDQERSDIGYLSLPDTHSTTQPEIESRFYFRIQIRSGMTHHMIMTHHFMTYYKRAKRIKK